MDNMIKAVQIRAEGAGSGCPPSVSLHQHHRPSYETGSGAVPPNSSSEMESHSRSSTNHGIRGNGPHSHYLESGSQSYYGSRHHHHHHSVHRHSSSSHHHIHRHSSANGHQQHFHYNSARQSGQYHHHGPRAPSQHQSQRHYPSNPMHHSRTSNQIPNGPAETSTGPNTVSHGSNRMDNGRMENSKTLHPPPRSHAHHHFPHHNGPSSNHVHPQNNVHRAVFHHGRPPHPSTHGRPPHAPRSQKQCGNETKSSNSVKQDTPASPSSSAVVKAPARPMPLQPVPQNPNIPSPQVQKPSDKKGPPKPETKDVVEQPKLDAKPTTIEPAASKENSDVKDAPHSTQKQPKTNPFMAMKSPVTLCFERMLGAAHYLAQNPTPDVVREKLSKKRKEAEKENELRPIKQEHEELVLEPVGLAYDEVKPKRAKTHVTSSGTIIEGGEGNPFIELENDEELLQKVILQMALISESKETKRVVTEPVSNTIGEGFYWRDYPVLEEILFDNMKNYYNMSSQNRQSRHQQEFNNRLVVSIRQAAADCGYDFEPAFNDKRLRDRIRCFYKTHLQNAKKRLATLQKHPNSPIHQSHLRIYIRCVKENMSVEDSEALESGSGAAPSVVLRKRKQEGTH